jgi:hypothetical protein
MLPYRHILPNIPLHICKHELIDVFVRDLRRRSGREFLAEENDDEVLGGVEGEVQVRAEFEIELSFGGGWGGVGFGGETVEFEGGAATTWRRVRLGGLGGELVATSNEDAGLKLVDRTERISILIISFLGP